MRPSRSSTPPRKVRVAGAPGWVLLLAALAMMALVTRTAATEAHEWSRLGTVEGLVERWDYSLESSQFRGTGDKILYDGHFYSHQAPLLATLEAPVYWVLHFAGLRFWNSALFDLAYYLFTLLTNGLALALTIVIFDQLLELGGVVSRMRTLFAFLLPLGTWLFPYAVVSNNHGIAGCLLGWAILLLLRIALTGPSPLRCGLLGAAMGLLAAIEVTPMVSFVPLVTLWVVARPATRTRSQLGPYAIGLLIPLIAHTVINLPITGDAIPAGFHSELFNYPGSRFDQSTLTGQWHHQSFQALIRYAWRSLFAGKGFFTFSPLLLLGPIVGLIGWRWWARARGVQLVLLGGSALSLAASLLMTNNFGGLAVGFRHATYLAPALLALMLPALTDRRPVAAAVSWAIATVAGASAVVLLVFAVCDPWAELTLPPTQWPTRWQEYVPVVGQAVGQASGELDSFGKPLVHEP